MKTNLIISAASAALLMLAGSCCNAPKESAAQRWTEEKANAWYAELPWMAGVDYIPASAINQIEMWSQDTYDAPQIDKELGWAEELGFNTLRVYLSSVVYDNDPEGYKQRMDDFLSICEKHGIRPLFCIFDDCWNEESAYGPQPEPKPGVHNSGWVQDPSKALRADTLTLYPKLEKYVKDLLTTFGQDQRVLLWDLWNEPGNSGYGVTTLPALKKVVAWAREANPSQPITIGIWRLTDDFRALNAYQIENSDVISYHNYHEVEDHKQEIKYLKMFNRPLICTEYMARRSNSLFKTVMPVLKENKIVAINWGFVSGKTNTIFAWDEPLPDLTEPKLWFHDIYRQDKTPFDQAEVDTIKALTGAK
ncbi:MAG: cellulase family glycosylhydrolase [Bacteroidaceae bacterium]|nr:cellulase family glycosylhydrolase [Bacteroidaceae bacterium]